MKGTWADREAALEHALAVLAERYLGEQIEIIECFDIGYVAWECDYMGALITRDGMPEIVVVDETSGDDRPVPVRLRERIDEYRRLIDDTERVLQKWLDMRGGEMPDAVAAAIEGEVTRGQQLADAGGRIAIDVGELTSEEIELLKKSTAEKDDGQ